MSMDGRTNSDAPKHIDWVLRSNGIKAPYSVRGGIDSKANIYIARAQHGMGIIPGKLHIGHKCAYIPLGGLEIAKQDYEVLVAPPDTLSWVETEGHHPIPEHAVRGGFDPYTGDTYYIGRTFHQGTVTVGKIHPRYGKCFIPHGGSEHSYSKYEILVRNALGRLLDV